MGNPTKYTMLTEDKIFTMGEKILKKLGKVEICELAEHGCSEYNAEWNYEYNKVAIRGGTKYKGPLNKLTLKERKKIIKLDKKTNIFAFTIICKHTINPMRLVNRTAIHSSMLF